MMIAAIVLPEINPIAFPIGPFEIHWYALAYVVGLLFAAWYLKRLVTFPKLWGAYAPTLNVQQVDDMFIWFLLGVIGGGRLGYVLLYKPAFYFANPLEIFKTWDGGMSFHGGFLGVVIACWFYGRKHGIGLDRLLDLGAAVTPVGLGLGRIANFINVELWGRASDVPWAVVFPGQSFARHPSQLYEALLEGVVLFAAVRIATHWYGALQHRGRAAGIFALGYGVARITVEYFREPDSNIGYIAGFITMGMILSLPLVAIGVWLLLRSRHVSA
jgi:phosphatidylglycerol---prolipoprotein diacylglyceryl transferase